MKVEAIVNEEVTLVLVPENDLDAEILRKLTNQKNEIIDIRSGASVLGKTFNNGVVIKKEVTREVQEEHPVAEALLDEPKGED